MQSIHFFIIVSLDEPAASLLSRAETDQLLADIDDMLADLNTHLDFMIPGSS